MPPNDPRFLALTPEDVEAEFWAYQYADDKVTEEFSDEDFDIDAIVNGGDDEWETVVNDSR